jgi:hypothetical protein
MAASQLHAIDAHQGQGGTLSGAGAFNVPVMDLNAADASGSVAWQDANFVASGNPPAPDGPGGDGPNAAYAERAIDGHSEEIVVEPGVGLVRRPENRALQLVEAVAAHGGRVNDGPVDWPEDVHQLLSDRIGNQIAPLAIHQVRLADHGNAALNAQQSGDPEMFERLRHGPFVSRYDQQK